VVSISDPDDVQMVLRSESKFPKRSLLPLIDQYRQLRQVPPGLAFAVGEEWYKHRTVLSKKMLRPPEVAAYCPTFDAITNEFLIKIHKLRGPANSPKEYEVHDLENELFRWSFENISTVLFDKRFGCLDDHVDPDAQAFIDAVGDFFSCISSLLLIPQWFHKIYETPTYKRFIQSMDTMYEYTGALVEEKKIELMKTELESSEDKPDFFRFLLSSGKLTENDLLASVIDLLFAGVDTTSNTMLWVLYMMSQNPTEQQKLHHEVSTVLKPGEPITVNTLSSLPYLKAWIKETLRMYPIIAVLPRRMEQDLILRGYHVPAGTTAFIHQGFMGRDEALFPHPNSFRPERWLRGEAPLEDRVKNTFASIPFGFGRRMCVGRRLAGQEVHVLTARIAQRYEVTYPEGEEEVEPTMILLTVPDRPLRVKFNER
ncbi:predicted protein, partial [Nematostella vectensis]